jgi:hypothetical protein
MTLTHYSVLNQIFYPYKKFDDIESISSLEPWMFLFVDKKKAVTYEIKEEPVEKKVDLNHSIIKEKKPENSRFFSKKQDTLFWAAYAVFHGEAGYWVIGNKYKNTEIAEKQKIIDAIRTTDFLKRSYAKTKKMSNVRIQEIMSELMLDKKTSWNTFAALCAFYKFRALVIRGKTYMEFSPEVDNSMGTYLFYKNEDGHISVDLTAITDETETHIRNTHLQIDCDENKPLKAASNYKMEDLMQMARTLGLDLGENKVKKAELYDKIISKCIL